MLDQICAHIHNYFTADEDIHAGTWTIEGGTIDLSDMLLNGQYFRIVGSTLNDGVYEYPPTPAQGQPPILSDETFRGEIWAMKVPKALRDLAGEIAAWQAQYGAVMASPYVSENVIGVYSYSKGAANGSAASAAGTADGWKSIFRTRLNPWRKLR